MTTAYVGKYEDAGSRNTFYRLNNHKYGFKSFESKSLAEFAYRVQKRLADNNLAPRVYGEVGRIRVPIDQYETELSDWGYITEIARSMSYCPDECCCNDCSIDSDCKNGYIMQSVVDELENHGLSYVDAHPGNFGFVRRNRVWLPVVIDVGYESFDDIDLDLYGPDPYDDDESDEGCDCSMCREARGVM